MTIRAADDFDAIRKILEERQRCTCLQTGTSSTLNVNCRCPVHGDRDDEWVSLTTPPYDGGILIDGHGDARNIEE